jgi:hemolysin activation/secretion protein
VPFYLQPTLGGAYSLRGLRPYRLRDRNLLLLQGEYRWEVNAFLTGTIFYDAGKVAFRRRDLDLDDLNHDYGIGVRFGWMSGVAMRADVAFGSGEGTRFVLRFDDVF